MMRLDDGPKLRVFLGTLTATFIQSSQIPFGLRCHDFFYQFSSGKCVPLPNAPGALLFLFFIFIGLPVACSDRKMAYAAEQSISAAVAGLT